jgi:ElaB/YqjD/DUF883 family membrane-anchored ribosome-binding protein
LTQVNPGLAVGAYAVTMPGRQALPREKTMTNAAIETDEFLKKLASESTRRGKSLRAAVRDLTVRALQRRELTLEQIRNVLENVTVGVTLGVVDREMNVERVLSDALSGMDDALLKAVEASRVALERLASSGQDYEDSYLRQALRDLEKFEDAMLQSVTKAADRAGGKFGAQWAKVLHQRRASGTGTGAKVAAVAQEYARRARTSLREQRETGFRAAHLMTQNFATLASGVLIGMSEALEAQGAASGKKPIQPKVRKGAKPVKRAPAATGARAKRTRAAPRTSKRAGSAKRATAAKRPGGKAGATRRPRSAAPAQRRR